MKDKKIIVKRLMVLYLTFILVVVLSIVARVVPDLKRGYDMGAEMGELAAECGSNYILPSVSFEPYTSALPVGGAEPTTTITAYPEQMTFVVAPSDYTLSSPFAVIAGNSLYYVIYLIIAVSFIWMIVLMARIIFSVRRSMLEERSVESSNARRVRFIGAILILSELLYAFTAWRCNVIASELVEGSGIDIITSFSPDYWMVMLGILIIFMGELFSIAHRLSEEQKFTI